MKSEYEQGQMISEIRAMRSLDRCEGTVRLYKVFESDNYLNLLMEYQQGGCLSDILDKPDCHLSEESIKLVTEQLLLTIDFMTRRGIVHRDLKPDNVLLFSKEPGTFDIRVADFGYALELKDQGKMENILVCGTPGYIAPEGISGRGLSLKTDIFSVGAILFNMLTRKPLFSGDEYMELMLQNKRCQWDNIDHRLRHCSLKARDLVTWLLTKDPSKRPTAKQALHHRWFNNHRVGITTSLNLNRVLASKPNPTLQEIQEVLNSPEPGEQIDPFKRADDPLRQKR